MTKRRLARLKFVAAAFLAWGIGAAASVGSLLLLSSASDAAAVSTPVALDRSGAPREGKASFYARRYGGRRMADGTRMRLDSNNAASLTLPLGTTARVTNLKTGLSAVVVIRDRGPYVRGRIVDLSPMTARRIGLQPRQGLADVRVTPLTLPLRNGHALLIDPARVPEPRLVASMRSTGSPAVR
jgi:rare lipoprotein A